MDLEVYQTESAKYIEETINGSISYLALGLCGEAGEVAEKVKKQMRDQLFVWDRDKQAMLLELGDILWYVSQISTHFGVSLSEVANMNLDKLESRKLRGTTSGDGDYR